jgi:hypothetical protein
MEDKDTRKRFSVEFQRAFPVVWYGRRAVTGGVNLGKGYIQRMIKMVTFNNKFM